MDKKNWAMRKVEKKLAETTTDSLRERVSNGNISLGISHPIGPQDQAKPQINVHISTTQAMTLGPASLPVVGN